MLYRLTLERPAHWRVRATDPLETPLAAKPGWFLISPLRLPRAPGSPLEIVKSDGYDTLLTHDDLVFRVPDDQVPANPEDFTVILKWMRFVTGQSGLLKNLVGGQTLPESALWPPPQMRPLNPGITVVRHFELTAISSDLIGAHYDSLLFRLEISLGVT